jgi:hypothetical protein
MLTPKQKAQADSLCLHLWKRPIKTEKNWKETEKSVSKLIYSDFSEGNGLLIAWIHLAISQAIVRMVDLIGLTPGHRAAPRMHEA